MSRLASVLVLLAPLAAGCAAPPPAPSRETAPVETGLQEITILAKGLE